MIRKGIRPGFRPAIDLPGGPGRSQGSLRRVFPFRRPWIAILVLAIMDAVFIFPAVGIFAQASAEWSSFDSLFELVAAVFMSAWLLGWLIAPLLMTVILALMLFGREVIRTGAGTLEIFIGLPVLGVVTSFDVSKMRNLRVEHPLAKSGKSWRGTHFVFEYGANSVAFGSAVNSEELDELKSRIQLASGQSIRVGRARAEETQSNWQSNGRPEKEPAPEFLSAGAVQADPVTLTSISSLTLIMANLIPVGGTIFLDWNLSDVMVLYWAESAVIGFFNLCKIAVIDRWMALLAGPFFVGHFGGFMAVHFLFIYTIFVVGVNGDPGSGDSLAQVTLLFVGLWPAIAALFLSHAFSFFMNFIGRREYRSRSVRTQMSEPYSRIIFMHLVLILGGGLTLILGQPVPVLIIVIGLKIYFDLRAHLKERVSA